ncbi:hypothetical protein SMD20_21540 [Nonomuraea sp. LP-02]|uniref:hypothetical protein n=1 Tax=Nonomuraea sp. LP-02 TaxID=3097960 RepID=UPI002E36DF6D|nr:hypothetical protein [Nonomuraea sp. LP-02]MED7926854.1 hypothetical protein [Nonomuraea sp. LP-02]
MSADEIGLGVRALHERGHAGDLAEIAAVRHLYSFRELESLARRHHESFSVHELADRLEFAELIADEEFEAYGLDEEGVRAVRRFAREWLEDIKLRRADDGDVDYDAEDVPGVD